MTDVCVIIGGGGHAKVLIECLALRGGVRIEGILEKNKSQWGKNILDISVLGGDELIDEMPLRGVRYFVLGIGGIGDNGRRQRLFHFGIHKGLEPMTIIHPTAIVSSWATVGSGCQILSGAIINPGAVLGRNVIINSGAIVEHDCIIGEHAHIATGAKLGGGVHVGVCAHVGLGASVRQCINVGDYAIVGAGAVVTRDVPDGETVTGCPARPFRKAFS